MGHDATSDGVNTIHCRRSGSIPGRNQPQSALVLGVCSLSQLCSQTSRLMTRILGLGNRGNFVVELRCQSVQLSEVWHCIRLKHGIVSDDGRGPLLHISLDLRRGPFLEPAKERAGNNRRVLPQESCDFAVGVTTRAVGPRLKTARRIRRDTSALRGQMISALLGNLGRRATGAGGGAGLPSSKAIMIRRS